MNMQVKYFYIGPLDERTYQNCITDYIKTGHNSGLKMFWADICLFMFFMILFNSFLYSLIPRFPHCFLDSGDFNCLVITFANSLFPDQNRQNVGPDLDTDRLTL